MPCSTTVSPKLCFREIRSECSNRNAIENEELTNETTVSSIEDKSCHLISLVSKMETSFDSSGLQKIGCCGVSSSNKSMISENVCPKNDAEGEIGHLPGQKWPHVICRRNSRIHCHVKVLEVDCYEYHCGRLTITQTLSLIPNLIFMFQ